jgi:hypothetical protein
VSAGRESSEEFDHPRRCFDLRSSRTTFGWLENGASTRVGRGSSVPSNGRLRILAWFATSPTIIAEACATIFASSIDGGAQWSARTRSGPKALKADQQAGASG